MNKILIGGAGGAPSENVIRSLLKAGDYSIVGVGAEPVDLVLSAARTKYQIPFAHETNHKTALLSVCKKEKPALAHFQFDHEILQVSRFRDELLSCGAKVYMPKHTTIERCVDKAKSSEIWAAAGVKIPKTMLVKDEHDLKKAFEHLANKDGMIWIRATTGGGGRGALPAGDFAFAKLWIERFNGWGAFTAAELLTPDTVTWSSIWFNGELVTAQTRRRREWNFGNRTLSGVTGITRVGETYSSEQVNRTAQDAILSIDETPHGIFSVDMAYDAEGVPNPTEINISRFFTTIYFFTEAGLNMPKIFADIALKNQFPVLEKKINPLPDGLLWIRAMDRAPLLVPQSEFTKMYKQVSA